MSHDVSCTLEGLLQTVVLLQELQDHSLHPASYPMAVPGWGSSHCTHIHVVQTFSLITSIHTGRGGGKGKEGRGRADGRQKEGTEGNMGSHESNYCYHDDKRVTQTKCKYPFHRSIWIEINYCDPPTQPAHHAHHTHNTHTTHTTHLLARELAEYRGQAACIMTG